jgi:hypothetical protein
MSRESRAAGSQESSHERFIREIRKTHFVRVRAGMESLEEIAAAVIIVNILEKELVGHEVCWGPGEETADESPEIVIGEAMKRGKKVGVMVYKQMSGDQDSIVFIEGPLLRSMYDLCRSTGHLDRENLWAICVGLSGSRGRYDLLGWGSVIRDEFEYPDDSSEGAYEEGVSDDGCKRECLERGRTPSEKSLMEDVEDEVGRIGGRGGSGERRIERKKEVYFPFVGNLSLYEALLCDAGVVGELGLCEKRFHEGRAERERGGGLFREHGYHLNEFLARVGISIGTAKSSGYGNLLSGAKRIVEKSFAERVFYSKEYERNVNVSSLEICYYVADLVRKRDMGRALFAFRSMGYSEVCAGRRAYVEVSNEAKEAFSKRRVVKCGNKKVFYIPRGVVVSLGKEGLLFARMIFVEVCRLGYIHVRRMAAKRRGECVYVESVVMSVEVAEGEVCVLYGDPESEWNIEREQVSAEGLNRRVREIAGRLAERELESSSRTVRGD